MRSSLIISVAIHIAITIIAFNWVAFREVKYIPREVYKVAIISAEPAEAAPILKKPEPVPEPPPPEPEPIPEIPEPEPESEIKPVPTPPKEKDPPKRKEIPKTEIQKTPDTPVTDAAESNAPAETGDVSLDADDFPFAHYIGRMRRKIASHWRVPQGSQGQDRVCRIYFRVSVNGSVSDVAVEESSGLFMFDQAAQRAVLQSAPMPPLPREYREPYLGVHFSFAYREKK